MRERRMGRNERGWLKKKKDVKAILEKQGKEKKDEGRDETNDSFHHLSQAMNK
jgi:hypothetical protein